MSAEKPKPLDSDTQEIQKSPSIPREVPDYSEGVPAADYPLNPDPPAEDEPAEAPAKPAKEDEEEDD
jgi:hypothetical protein